MMSDRILFKSVTMDKPTHSSLQSVMEYQRNTCDFLKNVTEVRFGLDENNKKLVEELGNEVTSLRSGINELKMILPKIRAGNEHIKIAVDKIQAYDTFLDDLKSQNDFQRLFPSPEKLNKTEPRSARKPVKKFTLSISEISNEEYETVPFYSRGRIKVEEVNEFISSINSTVSKKYQILQSTRLSKYEERQLQLQYHFQQQSCPGQTFFTEEDLQKFGFLRNTIAVPKLITILRATHRIKEMRSQGSVKFVIAH